MKVLFASSEVWPLIKTGGLGDVAYSLPHALQTQGMEIRLVLPAYRAAVEALKEFKLLGWLPGLNENSEHPIRVFEAQHPQFSMPLWLIDSQGLFDRSGNPYTGDDGQDWPDNAERFTRFSYAVAQLACDGLANGWRADIVHCNDWQTGLVPAFLQQCDEPPASVFTVHNLAYRGEFSKQEFVRLGLPWEWWHHEGVEFHGGFSMLKSGLVYADAITTVSPTYAREICTPEFGYGMEGVLEANRHKLSGILNGIDTQVWDPGQDELIVRHYGSNNFVTGKRANKKALFQAFGLTPGKAQMEAPLLGLVGRLVEQKGVDLILALMPDLIENSDANFVFVGSGDEYYSGQIEALANAHPERVMAYIGYSEQLAHLLEAGADMFLMPSRFEPCGLNQLYSMRYGTPPIVHHTGGLADTVSNASDANLAKGVASGFVFKQPTARALSRAITSALKLYRDKTAWRKLQKQAMRMSFDWRESARQYIELYRNSLPNNDEQV